MADIPFQEKTPENILPQEEPETASLLCEPLAKAYYRGKREFEQDGSEESRAVMLKAKRALDSVKEVLMLKMFFVIEVATPRNRHSQV